MDFTIAPEQPPLPVWVYTIMSDTGKTVGMRWVTERMALAPDLPICHTAARRDSDRRPYRMVFREHYVGLPDDCVEEGVGKGYVGPWMVSCLGSDETAFGYSHCGDVVDDPIDFLLTGRVPIEYGVVFVVEKDEQ